MMERHNRKSYLGPVGPPPARSFKNKEKESSSTSSSSHPNQPPKPAPSKPSRTPHYTPTTGEIPLNIVNDVPSHHNHHQRYYPTSSHPSPRDPVRSTRSPPPVSLEHLSLETTDDEHRYGRRPSRHHLGDPYSAVDAPTRPHIGSRSASSNNTRSRTGLQSAALPIRAPPPPSGPPPAAPVSAGGSWRRQPN